MLNILIFFLLSQLELRKWRDWSILFLSRWYYSSLTKHFTQWDVASLAAGNGSPRERGQHKIHLFSQFFMTDRPATFLFQTYEKTPCDEPKIRAMLLGFDGLQSRVTHPHSQWDIFASVTNAPLHLRAIDLNSATGFHVQS